MSVYRLAMIRSNAVKPSHRMFDLIPPPDWGRLSDRKDADNRPSFKSQTVVILATYRRNHLGQTRALLLAVHGGGTMRLTKRTD